MPAARDKTAVYGSDFAELVAELGVDVSDQLLPALQMAEALRDERVRRGQEDYERTGLTRTVVLLGCFARDDNVKKALLSSNLDVQRLLNDVGLDSLDGEIDASRTNFRVHPQVADAVRAFRSEFRDALRLDSVGLSWALLLNDGTFLERLSQAGLDLDTARATLRSLMDSRRSELKAKAPAEPVVVSPGARIARYLSDGLDDEDQLDIRPHVEAMASVIASKDMEPPLAIGLFGPWGSGKSFFMKQLESAIESRCEASRQRAERTGSKASPYVTDVVPIWFNAWHYMDASLWPSLVVHIFDALAKHIDQNDPDQARVALFQEMELARGKVKAAENEHRAVEAALKAEEEHLENTEQQARAIKPVRHMDMKLLTRNRPDAMQDLLALAGELGITIDGERRLLKDVTRDVKRSLEDLQGVLPRLSRLLGGTLPSVHFKGWIAVAAFTALVLVAFVWWLAQTFEYDWSVAKSAVAWVGIVATTAVTKLLQAGQTARNLSAKLDRIADAERVAASEEQRRRTERRRELKEEARRSKEQVLTLRRELEEARQRLEETKNGFMLERFIQERSHSDDYRKNLGVIARIREDFGRLEELFLGARNENENENEKSNTSGRKLRNVDRIVLYIDDLDRCPRERVVDIIQAVHLLLALRLFVVVVAIDPRWLHSSFEGSKNDSLDGLRFHIEKEDDQELAEAAREDGKNGKGNETSEPESEQPEQSGNGRATALNYLEKIFQIPFTLGEMRENHYQTLIEHLTQPIRDPAKDETTTAGTSTSEHPSSAPPAERLDPGNQEGATNAASNPGEAPKVQRTIADVASATPDAPTGADTPMESPSQPVPQGTLLSSEQDQAELLNVAPLSLSELEREYLAAVGPPILRTPRAAKRLVNSYRVLRASMHHSSLGGFSTYECAIVLMALAIGFPARAGKIFSALEQADPKSHWLDVLSGPLKGRSEALAALRELPLDWADAGSFASVVPSVRRYSFFT